RRIVLAIAVARIGGEERRALIEIERDVALQAEREAAISAGGEAHRATACGRRRRNRAVDGRRVERLPVAARTKRPHVVNARGVSACTGLLSAYGRQRGLTIDRRRASCPNKQGDKGKLKQSASGH